MIHLNVLDAWSNWNNSKIHKLMSEHLLSLYWIENMLKKHLGNLYLGVQRMLSMSIYTHCNNPPKLGYSLYNSLKL